MQKYSLGFDFGTESVRALLVDIKTGDVIAHTQSGYRNGVINHTLKGSKIKLPPDWALQNPQDWLTSMAAAGRAVIKKGIISPDNVIGIGVDFTACTILPTDSKGEPLCFSSLYKHDPHAWAKLWKHHAAWRQAERINQLAGDRNEPWLSRYGNKIYSEWVLPKALQMVEESLQIYDAADYIIEGADWIIWQLTGNLIRSSCHRGYKATWYEKTRHPSPAYLQELHPALGNLYTQKLRGMMASPGSSAGGLNTEWAQRLGLHPGTPVAVPLIDAHAAMIGSGIAQPGTLLMIMGTSTCHLLLSDKEVMVPGISGVVKNGILPGLYGYEAGQASVGDIFQWFVDCLNPSLPQFTKDKTRKKMHDLLTEEARVISPGKNGLLALDWWNGNRSVLGNANLSGMLIGLNLTTTPAEIYRALLEATAYGTKIIINNYRKHGVKIEKIVAGGGLTQNSLLMQIYADILESEIKVSGGQLASAIGAAILGAVAGGKISGGYGSLPEAMKMMTQTASNIFYPDQNNIPVYRKLFREYYHLYQYFGKSKPGLMNMLRELSN